jgi:hypothetical protein
MWSLRQTLQDAQFPVSADLAAGYIATVLRIKSIFPHGHLPDEFDVSRGIRPLFPGGQTIKLSFLKRYIFSHDGSLATGPLSGNFRLRADGTGNYYLNVSVTNDSSVIGGRWGAGFVFGFSTDSVARGIVATGDYSAGDNFAFAAAGLDAWIHANWPQAFASGAFFYISYASGFKELPPITLAATDHGFTGLNFLHGVKPGDQGPGPGDITYGPSFDLLWGE